MSLYNNSLNSAEQGNETSWYKAFGAGLASGIIKIPEGIVSLGAELIDQLENIFSLSKRQKSLRQTSHA